MKKKLDYVPFFYHLVVNNSSRDMPLKLRPTGDLVRGERDTGCPERPDMLVRELKEELEARDQPKTGNKAWLRRMLHGAIVRAHLAERDREGEP